MKVTGAVDPALSRQAGQSVRAVLLYGPNESFTHEAAQRLVGLGAWRQVRRSLRHHQARRRRDQERQRAPCRRAGGAIAARRADDCVGAHRRQRRGRRHPATRWTPIERGDAERAISSSKRATSAAAPELVKNLQRGQERGRRSPSTKRPRPSARSSRKALAKELGIAFERDARGSFPRRPPLRPRPRAQGDREARALRARSRPRDQQSTTSTR